MVILGIDPALAITGYGVIGLKAGRPFLIEAGIVKTSAREETSRRLEKINRAISKLILDTRPDIAALEKLYAHYRHPVTAYLLGQARGVICLACAQAGIPVAEYAATRVKKAIVGNGLASKAQVQRMVAVTLGLRQLPKYTDVSDALALALAHGSMLRLRG